MNRFAFAMAAALAAALALGPVSAGYAAEQKPAQAPGLSDALPGR